MLQGDKKLFQAMGFDGDALYDDSLLQEQTAPPGIVLKRQRLDDKTRTCGGSSRSQYWETDCLEIFLSSLQARQHEYEPAIA